MDTDCRDEADYARCLADLARVNRLTLTHRPMLAWLAAETADGAPFSLLDVACGHGDALRAVARWAARRGQVAQLTGIDRHPWAINAARTATPDPAIRFVQADVFAWTPDPRPDFIVSAQFAHHLDEAALIRFIAWMEATARRGWFIGDLHRHHVAHRGFPLLARLAGWHRFVRHDGQVSIARGFRPSEWPALLAAAGLPPQAATIRRHLPFRLSVARRCTPR
ncbi:MAG: methyltransferase domain-containing protein [Rhodospirillales bacterium]|nr:methyltransferase domain-containing protein [Rhodospirillales bacterium]